MRECASSSRLGAIGCAASIPRKVFRIQQILRRARGRDAQSSIQPTAAISGVCVEIFVGSVNPHDLLMASLLVGRENNVRVYGQFVFSKPMQLPGSSAASVKFSGPKSGISQAVPRVHQKCAPHPAAGNRDHGSIAATSIILLMPLAR